MKSDLEVVEMPLKEYFDKWGHDPSRVITLEIPPDPEYVKVVRLAASGIASQKGFNVEEVDDIKVALAEACTNAIAHGYRSERKPTNTIIIRFLVGDPNALYVSVTDKGTGFDVKSIPAQPHAEAKQGATPHLGVGIYLIRQLMDEVLIHSGPDHGTIVYMQKRRKA